MSSESPYACGFAPPDNLLAILEGHGGKNIDKLIELVNASDFEARLPQPQRDELLGIADAIEATRRAISSGNLTAPQVRPRKPKRSNASQ